MSVKATMMHIMHLSVKREMSSHLSGYNGRKGNWVHVITGHIMPLNLPLNNVWLLCGKLLGLFVDPIYVYNYSVLK
jgi:hypothetical protein